MIPEDMRKSSEYLVQGVYSMFCQPMHSTIHHSPSSNIIKTTYPFTQSKQAIFGSLGTQGNWTELQKAASIF